MTNANYQTAGDAFDGWRDDVLTGSPPVLYPIGTGDLARIEIGPGLETLFGGAPGAGKSAFVMQAVTDGLRLTPTLRALACSIEMPPRVLLDRQLARLSGIDLTSIRYRRFDASHPDRLDQAMYTLEAIGERLAFVRPPFDLSNVAASADAFHADLIVLDCIQRIPQPFAGPVAGSGKRSIARDRFEEGRRRSHRLIRQTIKQRADYHRSHVVVDAVAADDRIGPLHRLRPGLFVTDHGRHLGELGEHPVA
ncbi:MAG TPA: DnaB-like helicase C-terminal domain-containing protein [Pirellulales bacterium]|nr:DnaB-like helicase C-terminal domain-containing protein [Pirellulales bacterium]